MKILDWEFEEITGRTEKAGIFYNSKPEVDFDTDAVEIWYQGRRFGHVYLKLVDENVIREWLGAPGNLYENWHEYVVSVLASEEKEETEVSHARIANVYVRPYGTEIAEFNKELELRGEK